jgi:two-component system response regulator AtoC
MTSADATAALTHGCILLIEDEPSVAAFLRTALERRGYQITSSASAIDGLQLLATGDFRGVISDFRTPGGITGADVHDWLLRHRPELASRIIFITGDTASAETVALLAQNGTPCVEKTLPRSSADGRGRKDDWKTMRDESKLRFLIVDDEQSIRRLCMTVGQGLGFVCTEAETAESALESLDTTPPDIVVTDLKLPSLSGTELLKKIREQLPRAETAIMTGHGSIESAVEAMRQGAYDYIEKPFRVERLRQLLQRMAEKVRLVTENQFLRERVSTETQLDGIVGTSVKIEDVMRMISRLKETRTPVLITGESGTGKELVARAIHFRGPLAQMPFVAVDCGSLVPTLMESELFGHEKGSFTGALKTKAGLFQAANGGTIFLDEIGELPLELQAKLLRVLQEKEVRPVGSNVKVPVDVRVIAATNRDLESAYRAATFRKDLYFRLNVVTVHLPSLRERRSDIPQLAHCFLDRYAPGENIQVTADAMKSFLQYDWPGNVRELENCIARAVALGDHHTIDVGDLPPAVRVAPEGKSQASDSELSTTALSDLERMTILRVFEQAGGDKALAGRMLGISRATLYRKLKLYNIPLRSAHREHVRMAS